MVHLHLFTDGSVHPQLKVGYGAYLVVSQLDVATESLKASVKVKRFAPTSSSQLELQTFLWALEDVDAIASEKLSDLDLTAYTDSQNIISLPGRRHKLEQRNYLSRNNKPLKHAPLYQEFYRQTAKLNFELIKVEGHKVLSQKDPVDRLFSLVDQSARRSLRAETQG